MRILVDYRPALRARTGVGEFAHELVRAYAARHPASVTAFTSSWADRPAPDLSGELGVAVSDHRIPVRVLNLLWHRFEWPPVEWLAGAHDVVHTFHPLLMPARASAQVVTINDLFFLTSPDQVRGEIRRDYPALARHHACRADAVIAISEYTRRQTIDRLGVDPSRVHVCLPGAPVWRRLGTAPHVPDDGYVLHVGTLEPRKNVGVLLDAYAQLLEAGEPVPRLVLAGRATPDAEPWLRRVTEAPLRGRVEHLGYIAEENREALYAGARLLVMPSLDEGFGLPVLEAMSAGIPVIASSRGALPEVVGSAGMLIDAADSRALATAIARLTQDTGFATSQAIAGLARARAFDWARSADHLHAAYASAVRVRAGRRR